LAWGLLASDNNINNIAERTNSIRAISLNQSYGHVPNLVKALSDFNYNFEAGKSYAISGPSGSGKSSLLRILGLIDKARSGELQIGQTFFNRNCSEQTLRNFRLRKIGYVFQSFELLSYLNSLENVSLSLELLGISSIESKIRARECLSNFGLEQRLLHLPDQLSGGEKQRVALARAFVKKPELLIADEPTGSLDSQSGKIVLDALLQAADAGTTVIIATHSQIVSASCNFSLRLKDGYLEA
jgi:putative ABC transport system ATP-binding protein